MTQELVPELCVYNSEYEVMRIHNFYIINKIEPKSETWMVCIFVVTDS